MDTKIVRPWNPQDHLANKVIANSDCYLACMMHTSNAFLNQNQRGVSLPLEGWYYKSLTIENISLDGTFKDKGALIDITDGLQPPGIKYDLTLKDISIHSCSKNVIPISLRNLRLGSLIFDGVTYESNVVNPQLFVDENCTFDNVRVLNCKGIKFPESWKINPTNGSVRGALSLSIDGSEVPVNYLPVYFPTPAQISDQISDQILGAATFEIQVNDKFYRASIPEIVFK